MSTTTLNAHGSLLGDLWQQLAGLFSATPKSLSRSEEASEVREMARRLQATDPGFAADLFAAADRHETTSA